MRRTFVDEGRLQKSWGSQSWLQPPFRRLFGPQTPVDSPKEPAKSRLRARFPAPRLMQNPDPEKVRGIGQDCQPHNKWESRLWVIGVGGATGLPKLLKRPVSE